MTWLYLHPGKGKAHFWVESYWNPHWFVSLCGMGWSEDRLLPEKKESENDYCKRCQSILDKEGQS